MIAAIVLRLKAMGAANAKTIGKPANLQPQQLRNRDKGSTTSPKRSTATKRPQLPATRNTR